MVPWNKVPGDVRNAVLAMIIVYGGTQACDCRGPLSPTPMICDPAPPPRTQPRPVSSASPIPSPTVRPMIVDPTAPPPTQPGAASSPSPTPSPTAGPSTPPVICDPAPPPLPNPAPPAMPMKTPMICDPAPNPVDAPRPAAAGHQAQPQTSLPRAEIRTVAIVAGEGLTFQAETPWPGARFLWSTSGGALVTRGASATWQPPAAPGRYLLQVAADWGHTGLAVDALTLIVAQDGSIGVG